VSEKGVSKPSDRSVGSEHFEKVSHDLKSLFSVPDEVLDLARKELNDGQCVTVSFDGLRADLVRVGFIERWMSGTDCRRLAYNSLLHRVNDSLLGFFWMAKKKAKKKAVRKAVHEGVTGQTVELAVEKAT